MHHVHDADNIVRYVSRTLDARLKNRQVAVLRIARKSGGVLLWAQLVVAILNAAISEGATEKLIEETILEMPGDLDDLYEWLLSTLRPDERAESLALFQWVMLASEPLRLNDLRVAVPITKRWGAADMYSDVALSLGPPMSLGRLPALLQEDDGDLDSPYQFYQWVRTRSLGLLEARPERGPDDDDAATPSNEPLGLQRVHVIDESVTDFFLSGRGFAALEKDNETTLYSISFSARDLADLSHYVLLNACLTYLNMTDFECLDWGWIAGPGMHSGGVHLPPAPMPRAEARYWRRKVPDQRRLVMSSYPFLRYAVDNLVFHMLSPRYFRYYLPQRDVLRLFTADNCRLWHRWTALLGVDIGDAVGALEICAKGPARNLLDPVHGARYRLERVFRRVSKMALGKVGMALTTEQRQQHPPAGGGEHGATTVRAPPKPPTPMATALATAAAARLRRTRKSRDKRGPAARLAPPPPAAAHIGDAISSSAPPSTQGGSVAPETSTVREWEDPDADDMPLVRPLSPLRPVSPLSPPPSPRIQSFDSVSGPSISSPISLFSPAYRNVQEGSRFSAVSLLSPLSALEASFEARASELKPPGEARGI